MAPLYLDTGEPDAATSCTSGSEEGGWKSTHWVTRWPPTLLDSIFFLDLPHPAERKAICELYRRHFKIPESQAEPDDSSWTGAEIRACCRLAALLNVTLTQAAHHVVPIAATAAESMARLRHWASGRCLDASQPGIYQLDGAKTPRRARRISRPSNN